MFDKKKLDNIYTTNILPIIAESGAKPLGFAGGCVVDTDRCNDYDFYLFLPGPPMKIGTYSGKLPIVKREQVEPRVNLIYTSVTTLEEVLDSFDRNCVRKGYLPGKGFLRSFF